MVRRVLGAILGACLYRLFVAIALRLNVPAECMKLVSALIVGIAIASPGIKSKIAFERHKKQQRRGAAC